MKKSAADRWTEMINYLNAAFPAAVGGPIGTHINTIVGGGQRDAISKECALGSTAGVHKNTTANKPARNALRALLLCQRVYFSDLWAKQTLVGGVTSAYNYLLLAGNWKATTLTHWGMRSEGDIRSAIGMFATVPGATADKVSDVAQDDPPNGGLPGGSSTPAIAANLTYSRNHFPITGSSETCYRGVLAWMFKAGVVSYRWFMRNPAPTGQAALDELFGTGVDVWPRGTPFTATSVLPTFPKGTILHMWKEETGAFGWNGHWVVSNGDGTICGVNNGLVPSENVITAYTKTGTLRKQFEGYTELVKEKKEKKDGIPTGHLLIVHTGIAATCRLVKFDPLTVKNRM